MARDATVLIAMLGVASIIGFAGACRKKPLLTAAPIEWRTHTEAACAEARRTSKPVLFYWAAQWDVASMKFESETFQDPRVRNAIDEGYIPLVVDRTRSYGEDYVSDDERREVEGARARFHPFESKYGSLFIVAADCTTRLADLSTEFEPDKLLPRLEQRK